LRFQLRIPFVRLQQDWRNYDMRAQNCIWKDILGMRHSLLSQYVLFILFDQSLYIVHNVYVYVCVYIYIHLTPYRLYINYRCYQITLQ